MNLFVVMSLMSHSPGCLDRIARSAPSALLFAHPPSSPFLAQKVPAVRTWSGPGCPGSLPRSPPLLTPPHLSHTHTYTHTHTPPPTHWDTTGPRPTTTTARFTHAEGIVSDHCIHLSLSAAQAENGGVGRETTMLTYQNIPPPPASRPKQSFRIASMRSRTTTPSSNPRTSS